MHCQSKKALVERIQYNYLTNPSTRLEKYFLGFNITPGIPISDTRGCFQINYLFKKVIYVCSSPSFCYSNFTKQQGPQRINLLCWCQPRMMPERFILQTGVQDPVATSLYSPGALACYLTCNRKCSRSNESSWAARWDDSCDTLLNKFLSLLTGSAEAISAIVCCVVFHFSLFLTFCLIPVSCSALWILLLSSQ